MNKYQRVVVIVAAVNIALMLLFPPFLDNPIRRGTMPSFEGFYPLISALGAKRIHNELLTLQIMFVVINGLIAWLVLDVTPASIDWKKDILLGYVEPDQYGPLKTRQEVEAERLKRINASTVFAPQQLVPSEEGQSIVIRGRLRTLVNGFETANDLKAYRVEFSYAGARMHLKSFKEVPNAGN